MDDYIIKEGDVLGRHDGQPPIVVCRITKDDVTYIVRGDERKTEHTVPRARFGYSLWNGPFFLLEHAS